MNRETGRGLLRTGLLGLGLSAMLAASPLAAQNGGDTVTRTVRQEDRGMDWGWLGLLGLAGLLGLRRRDEHHHTDHVRVDPTPNAPPPRV